MMRTRMSSARVFVLLIAMSAASPTAWAQPRQGAAQEQDNVLTYHGSADRSGKFVVPGEGLRILSSLEPMYFVVFKAGYKYSKYQWGTLRSDIPTKDEEQVKWEGDVPVIPLKKLTIKERKMGYGPPDPPSEASLESVILMLREIDKDRIEKGLDARGFWGGKKYE